MREQVTDEGTPTPAGSAGHGLTRADDPASASLARIEGEIARLSGRFDTRDRLELVAGLILAVAAVIAAWSAYQNARWGGHQAAATSMAATLRTTAAQATSIAAAELDVDVQSFMAWLGAAAAGDTVAAEAFHQRMREPFKPVFDQWLLTAAPGAIPPGTPMDSPDYDAMASEGTALAVRANDLADEEIAKAAQANQTGDNFVLVTVIMAMVLFFAGIATRFGDRRVRRGLVGLAGVLLVGGTLFMLTQPVSFAV